MDYSSVELGGMSIGPVLLTIGYEIFFYLRSYHRMQSSPSKGSEINNLYKLFLSLKIIIKDRKVNIFDCEPLQGSAKRYKTKFKYAFCNIILML
jgi:hypothetical protein